MSASYQDFYRGRRVMITGGLGFIGSNIARQLVDLGADVLLMDSLIPDSGANFFNIDGIADRLRVNIADVRQESTMNHLVRDREIIFNLAGQVSHIDSMQDPYTDLEINCRSQLSILEACRKFNPQVKVVFAGTRQVYGKPDSLPVTEDHLVRPVDVNGINKAAGETIHSGDRDQAPEQRRFVVDDVRARGDAVDDERADHQRHHRVGGQAQGEQRDERRLRGGVVRRLGAGDALDRAAPELLRPLRDPLLDGVRGERGQHVATAGQHAERGAEAGAPQDRADDPAPVLARSARGSSPC